ncbi:NAD(P)/FAD-dependent oxidoreductase [Streptomyces chitinivorans]|uniref:NAD(P)/FAD-dependent oxidoreductase n=1 Tax=Streptomyces chitinivorans TaxID=1257027 RepID=A0ABW7HXN7_9ACTN|nr:FAD-binding oxidoreductase [Streptomyces chitinivorans]MDH2410419.1 FAD-binding oxidoreductase [Streptomyces chitinivorans]
MTAVPAAADVAVVGGGIIGLATAERLTARGASVIVVDEAGATGGATSASGGLVRAFEPESGHAAWAAEGCARYQARGWRGTWPSVRADGSLTLIDQNRLAEATAALETAHAAGHKADILTADEVNRRFPGLTVPGHLLGVLEPQAGWLPAADTARAILRDAGDRLSLRTARATGLLYSSSRVLGLHTSTGPVHADAVLLAAGVGSTALAASAGVHLPLSTRAIGYCLLRTEVPADLPTVVDRTTGAWLRRWDADGTVLAGVACARTGVPATVRAGVTAAEEHRVRTVVRHRCPRLAHARATGGVTAYDTLATDGPGTVTVWPRPRGLVTAVGWNGGGFKLAPAVGRHAAARILEVLNR